MNCKFVQKILGVSQMWFGRWIEQYAVVWSIGVFAHEQARLVVKRAVRKYNTIVYEFWLVKEAPSSLYACWNGLYSIMNILSQYSTRCWLFRVRYRYCEHCTFQWVIEKHIECLAFRFLHGGRLPNPIDCLLHRLIVICWAAVFVEVYWIANDKRRNHFGAFPRANLTEI